MSPVCASALELGGLSPIGKHAKRDKMLVILNKLSERDTSQAAVEELNRLIKVILPTLRQRGPRMKLIGSCELQGLDEDALVVLVSCLCATGTEQKILARKVVPCRQMLGQLSLPCLLLMPAALTGVYTGSGSACQSSVSSASPVLAAAASRKGHCLPESAHEGKPFSRYTLLASRAKRILAFCVNPAMTAFGTVQDPDSSVRETAADAIGRIAEHLYKQQNVLLPGESASNPVLKAAFDTMLERKKEMQQAGACALSQVRPLMPTCLVPDLSIFHQFCCSCQ